MSRRPISLNPFELIARKQMLGLEETNRLTLPFLVYLDAAKRGQGFIVAENGLVRWVAIAQIIGAKSGNKPFWSMACSAGQALFKAAGRGEELLALTTGEYAALKKLMIVYLKVLPEIEVQLMVGACARAEEIILKMSNETPD